MLEDRKLPFNWDRVLCADFNCYVAMLPTIEFIWSATKAALLTGNSHEVATKLGC